MASGFDSSVSRIQPRTKSQFFRPNINSTIHPNGQEKLEQSTTAVEKKETDEIETIQKPKAAQKLDARQNITSRKKPDTRGNKQLSGDKKGVLLEKKTKVQEQESADDELSKQPLKLYSIEQNNVSDTIEKIESSSGTTSDTSDSQLDSELESLNENRKRLRAFRLSNEAEEETIETIFPHEEADVQLLMSSQERILNTKNETIGELVDFTKLEPEKNTDNQIEETRSIQDKYKSLKKRLDIFIHQDSGKSVKKNTASENASTIKDVIKNYQSKIKHLTEELTILEDTYKCTRDELLMVKQELAKKTEALEQVTKLGQEKTLLSEEILKEMEITVFERDRAFTSIMEFKSANKSMEELLEKAYTSLEEKAKELEEVKVHEKEFLQTIKQKDNEIQALSLVLAKRTADRDDLFDRLEEITLQLEDVDKSNSALDEIKGLIDSGENGMLL